MHVQSLLALLSATAKVQDATEYGRPRHGKCHLTNEAPRLLNTATIPYQDSEVVITTYSLPQDGTLQDAEWMAPQDVCGGDCTQMSADFNRPTPSKSDCDSLVDFIQNHNGSFTALSQTKTTLTKGTCTSHFINCASKNYQYCYSDWASIAGTIVDKYIPNNKGAACVNADDHWGFEISGLGM